MKNFKKENGAIAILTIITILFMISFLIAAYILISNKVKIQKDIINETREIYESKLTMEEIYNSYLSDDNIIPIYTPEQLLMIGKDEKNIYVNGKYYDFNNDENTIYMLMNDLRFKASDYNEQLTDEKWIPIGDNEKLQAKFEGRNHSIEVIYDDDTKIYNQENNYRDDGVQN